MKTIETAIEVIAGTLATITVLAEAALVISMLWRIRKLEKKMADIENKLQYQPEDIDIIARDLSEKLRTAMEAIPL